MFPTRWSHGLQHLRHKRRNVRFEGLRRVHTCLRQQDRTQRLTRRNRGRFGWGCCHYPRTVPHVSETLRGQGVERQTLPILSLGRVCARRTQKAFGTAMRLCVSLSRRRRGPAGLRDLFVSDEITVFTPCAQGFPRVRDMGGITTLGALCVLPKRRTAACQNGSFAVFLCSLFTFVKDPAGHCQYLH